MPEPSSLFVFVIAAFTLLITPGPAVMYIVARSVDQGRLAGVISVLGVQTGALVHIFAAVVGLSALLAESALAFNIVKYLGAAYLIYLGIRKLFFEKVTVTEIEAPTHEPLHKVYLQGMVVNILNPKTALFFFAFLPQFIDPSRGSVAAQILFLGILFVLLAMCTDGMYALASGSLAGLLKGNAAVIKGQKYFAGSVYLLLGVGTALTGSSNK